MFFRLIFIELLALKGNLFLALILFRYFRYSCLLASDFFRFLDVFMFVFFCGAIIFTLRFVDFLFFLLLNNILSCSIRAYTVGRIFLIFLGDAFRVISTTLTSFRMLLMVVTIEIFFFYLVQIKL